MQVGDLIKRRNNGDLALILSIIRGWGDDFGLEVMRCDCGSIQMVWNFEYEVVK
jgi:hypothetical protein